MGIGTSATWRCFVALMLPCLTGTLALGATVNVPGTANLYGAGHSGAASTPAVTGPGGSGGSAPPSTPVTNIIAKFSASGSVDYGILNPASSPEGYDLGSPITFSSYNGISGTTTQLNTAAWGVFVGAIEPADPAPPTLNFVGNTSFATLAPALDQIFYIGDGLTGTGSGLTQEFTVPAGALTLYLGLIDGNPNPVQYGPGGYNDNSGSFSVEVTFVPEPTSGALFAGMFTFAVRAATRRRAR